MNNQILIGFVIGFISTIMLLLVITQSNTIHGFANPEMVCYDNNAFYTYKQNIVIHEQCHSLVFEDYEHFCGWKE